MRSVLLISGSIFVIVCITGMLIFPAIDYRIAITRVRYFFSRGVSLKKEDMPVAGFYSASKGTRLYAQGGVVVNETAFFSAGPFVRDSGKRYRRNDAFPFVVSFKAKVPFEKKRTYPFSNTYDSAPLCLETKSGNTLVIAHEYQHKRTKAIEVHTGEIEWISSDRHPGKYFFGYSFFRCRDNTKIVFGSFCNGLHAFRLCDGEQVWHIKKWTKGGVTPCVDQKKRCVYYQCDGGVLRIDAKTGKIQKIVSVKAPHMTISWNTVLVDDHFGYYIVTYWYGANTGNGAVRVYDRELRLVWERKNVCADKKATVTYADGKVIVGTGNSRKPQKDCGDECKTLTAWYVTNGTVAWQTDLSDYTFRAIINIPYFNGCFYAETQDVRGTSKLFRICAIDGTIKEILDYGRPITSCAPSIIANGMLFSGDLLRDEIVVTSLATGAENDWPGPFGMPQKNQYAVAHEEGIRNVPMKEITSHREVEAIGDTICVE